MIRFCDMEVNCIEYCSLSSRDAFNRADLLMYFLEEGHKDDLVCVYDDFNNMELLGIITYQSLNNSLTFRAAIRTERLTMDEHIWDNAREYIKRNVEYGENYLMPVVDRDGKLVCFAYTDLDADREIRQLRELSQMPQVMQFMDIYPEYKCVRIYGYNELAYFFAKYLKNQNVVVQVEGDMWPEFFVGNECCVPDYQCLNIYAEGTWEKSCNWKENLLRSVSVEFECIDKIYEANIKNFMIQDVQGDLESLLGYLRGKEEIILCGTDREEQNAYDFLRVNGIEVCCFIGVQNEEYGHVLFEKKIINSIEARISYKDAVFIDCKTRNSAWGFGGTDFYDYIGYKRNESFILLKDYVEVPENSLKNLLRDREIVLAGEINLCHRLSDYLEQNLISVKGYLNTMPAKNNEMQAIVSADMENIKENTLCLIVVPEYFRYESLSRKGAEEKKEIKRYLLKNGVKNYTDYFSDMISFIKVEGYLERKYAKRWLMPRKVILGSIEAFNGNEFFRGLLDSHPDMAVMYYSDMNNNLFWICANLAMEEASAVLTLFWKLVKGNEEAFFNVSAFNEKMEELLSRDTKFTSQELFVIFHVAYMYMCGRNLSDDDIKNMVIYWEPHHVRRVELEECVEWLGAKEVRCNIINVVRNICMQVGTGIKHNLESGYKGAYSISLSYPSIDRKDYEDSDRLVVKFEDLKCKPKEILSDICDKWGIKWADTLIETTRIGEKAIYTECGQKVTGFDLKPVYNTYEQFFSEFDRTRLMLINAPWQRKYGYPYVEVSGFTRKELQEMFLKDFRFEHVENAEENGDRLSFKICIQRQIKEKLQRVRMIEIKHSL